MNTTLETKRDNQLKQRQEASRKKTPSKLDEFASQLLQMAEEMKTIPEMLDWLKEREVTTSASNLSHFLKRQRMELERNELRERLGDEKDLGETVQEWFDAEASPKLETIIGVFKMLVLNLATKKEMDPQVLKLADRLTRTALGHVKDRERAAYRERKLVMEEAKHAEWIKCERMRAYELCLDESKKYPAVMDMYRAAFAALKEAMDGGGKAPSIKRQQPEKHQEPNADEAPKATNFEDEDEDENESVRRVKGNQPEARRSKRACGRRKAGKAARTKRQQPEKSQAPSTSESPAPEIEDEDEDEEDGEQSDPVGLSQIDLENATWRAQHGF